MSTAMSCGSPTVSGFLLNNFPTRKAKSDRNYRFRVSCASSSASDPYKTLRIRRGASESEVRKAFRSLALKYHPDVCRGNNCSVQFHEINEAYDTVMSNLRDESKKKKKKKKRDEYYNPNEQFRGMNDPDWDLWEEWMGWEGGGIRDYTSHINPYI